MKNRFVTSSVAALALLTSLPAISGVGSFILNTAIKVGHPIKSVKSISYGVKPWQTLNIYPQKENQQAPVIIFIYGGGWDKGTKEQYHFVADGLVRKGYMVVIPDYIKYPDATFPTFVEDIAVATAWVKSNIADYGGNSSQLFMVGHSAGAHTGALLMTDKHYLADVGVAIDDISGFVGLSGPYNFTPKKPQYIQTFGSENFEKMKVNNFVDGSEPPIKLIHGTGDNTVGRFNFDTFGNQLKGNGNTVVTKLYGRDIKHATTVLKIHPWFAGDVDIADEIDYFFQQHFD